MKIGNNPLLHFFKPSNPAGPTTQTASPAVHKDSVTLNGSPTPAQAPSENAPAPSSPPSTPTPQSVVDSPTQPKPKPNLHTKTLFMEDFHEGNFPSLAKTELGSPAASSGKTLQETLAQITKDLEPVKASHSKLFASEMLGLGGMGAALGSIGAMGAGVGAALGGLTSLGKTAKPTTTAAPFSMPTPPVEAAKDPATITPYQRAKEITKTVDANIAKMGTSAYYKVDQHLFPVLDKMGLDATEFFTARACWQGVNSKRRAVLEKVLDQFPNLPKDQKNVEGAMAAAEAAGTKITETDRYFLRYFFDHRKEMKTLFRASLNRFEGDKISVYRGQSDEPKWGKDSTKPLGCYSFDPSVSQSWGHNLKRYRVKLSDVWSTSVVSQNSHHNERELTVYSRGGVRKGEKVTNISQEVSNFKGPSSFSPLMLAAEGIPAPIKSKTSVTPATNAAHLVPAYGSD